MDLLWESYEETGVGLMDFGKTCYVEVVRPSLLRSCYGEVANLLQTCSGLAIYVADLLWTS